MGWDHPHLSTGATEQHMLPLTSMARAAELPVPSIGSISSTKRSAMSAPGKKQRHRGRHAVPAFRASAGDAEPQARQPACPAPPISCEWHNLPVPRHSRTSLSFIQSRVGPSHLWAAFRTQSPAPAPARCPSRSAGGRPSHPAPHPCCWCERAGRPPRRRRTTLAWRQGCWRCPRMPSTKQSPR